MNTFRRTFRKDSFTDSYGDKRKIEVKIRYDDECKNGHNSFAITGSTYQLHQSYSSQNPETFGCIHEEIIKAFPKLKKFIKWHLMNEDGPMHYMDNTLYYISDRDYNGLKKGEKKQIISGKTKLPVWEAVAIDGKGNRHDVRGIDWKDSATQPKDDGGLSWVPLNKTGEGKEVELEHARSSAVAPNATIEQLSSREWLENRLPALIKEFFSDLEELSNLKEDEV